MCIENLLINLDKTMTQTIFIQYKYTSKGFKLIVINNDTEKPR